MKILKYILIGIAAIVAIFLLIGLFAPKTVKMERSISIDAPSQLVIDQVRSLKNMNEWSPWVEMDPNIKIAYEGVDGEVGSSSTWEGNDKVGKGTQKVTSITTNKVETELHFIEPWDSKATGYFDFNDEDNGVKVTWGFESETPFPLNALYVFMNIDDMMGKEFEKGLNKLKVRSEEMAKAISVTPES